MPLYRISPELQVSGWTNLTKLKFYDSVWGATITDVFSKETVQRDERHLKLEVPPSRLVFQYLGRKFIVREDYIRACEFILGLVSHSTTTSSSVAASTSSRDKQHVIGMDDVSRLVAAFSRIDHRHQKMTECRGTNVIGHHGIGKFTYLIFVLIIRCLARLPTLLLDGPSAAFVFSDQGAFRVHGSLNRDICEPNQLMLPHGAWCLAGNISAPRMQSTIDGLDSFVIHASEPVGNVIDQVVRFCMKPWSLEELIVGRGLRIPDLNITEEQLQQYLACFNPSARNAYVYSTPERMEQLTDKYEYDLGGFSANYFDYESKVGPWPKTPFVVPQFVYNLAYVVEPLNDERLFCIRLSSHFVSSAVVQTYRYYPEDALTSFLITRLHYSHHDASLASSVVHHSILANGGKWQIQPLKDAGSKSSSYRFSPDLVARPAYLYIGGRRTFSIDPFIDKSEHCAPLKITDGELGVPVVLGGSFCRNLYSDVVWRRVKSDAFIYDGVSNSAIVFGTALSSRHIVDSGTIDMLRDKGVRNIDYIVVTPANPGAQAIGVKIPQDLVRRVRNIWSLEIPTGTATIKSRVLSSYRWSRDHGGRLVRV